LYSSRNIISHVARTGEKMNTYRVLVGKLEGKRPSARRRRRWQVNIQMNLVEVELDGMKWIHLA
jgi:hypothetical protein